MSPAVAMKIALFLGVLGLARAASSAICADTSKYTNVNITNPEGSTMTCDVAFKTYKIDQITTFDKATCTGMIDNPAQPGKKMAASHFFALAGGPCCDKTPTVCEKFLLNPCKDPSQFDGKVMVDPKSNSQCNNFRGLTDPFTATQQTCMGKVNIEADPKQPAKMMSRRQVLAMMGSCCKTGGTICDSFQANPCLTSSKFTPDAKITDGTRTCQTYANYLAAPMSPTKAQCFAQGSQKGKTVFDENSMAASMCCSDKKGSCYTWAPNPCLTKSAFTPDLMPAGLGGQLSCQMFSNMRTAPTSTRQECLKPGTTQGKTVFVENAEVAYNCCSDKVGTCNTWATNPCKDPAKFTPASTFHDGSTCRVNIGLNTPIEGYANKVSCKKIVQGKEKSQTTWEQMTADFAPKCCSGGDSVCKDPPELTTSTLAPTTTKGLETSNSNHARLAQVLIGSLGVAAQTLA